MENGLCSLQVVVGAGDGACATEWKADVPTLVQLRLAPLTDAAACGLQEGAWEPQE